MAALISFAVVLFVFSCVTTAYYRSSHEKCDLETLPSIECETYNEDENMEYNFDWTVTQDTNFRIIVYDHMNPDLLNTEYYNVDVTRNGLRVKSKITIKELNRYTAGKYRCIEIKKPIQRL